MNVYGYVYKITNKLNNKCYIGQKKSSMFVESYWGSGKLITAAIDKYGKQNFERVVLEWCESKESLNNAEIYWIEKCKAVEEGYNLSPGGNGGYLGAVAAKNTSEGLKRYYSNPENRKKLSESHIGVSNGQKGLTSDNCAYVRDRAERLHKRYEQGELVHPMKGKKHSKETIQKMSELKQGELNPFYGRHHTQESKDSMSQKLKGHAVTEEQRIKISVANSGSNNGMYGKDAPNKNKICITDGTRNKYIENTDLDSYISVGWWRGSTQRHTSKN